MESPIDVVRRFCAAWGNNMAAAELAAFFTDDAVYHNIPLTPVIGRQAIAKTIDSFIRPGAPGIERAQARSLLTYAFAQDILDRVKVQSIKDQLEKVLFEKFHEHAA